MTKAAIPAAAVIIMVLLVSALTGTGTAARVSAVQAGTTTTTTKAQPSGPTPNAVAAANRAMGNFHHMVSVLWLQHVEGVNYLHQRYLLAKAAERRASQSAVTSSRGSGNVPRPSGSCLQWMKQAGITDQASALQIIMPESHCDPTIHNYGGSGACGIPQDINGCEVGYDPVAQLRWMQNYVNSRYGSWANAVAYRKRHNNY